MTGLVRPWLQLLGRAERTPETWPRAASSAGLRARPCCPAQNDQKTGTSSTATTPNSTSTAGRASSSRRSGSRPGPSPSGSPASRPGSGTRPPRRPSDAISTGFGETSMSAAAEIAIGITISAVAMLLISWPSTAVSRNSPSSSACGRRRRRVDEPVGERRGGAGLRPSRSTARSSRATSTTVVHEMPR